MGHEILPGLSPAHRRSQTPASPSAMMFRRTGTQVREDNDLSWLTLIRRHRFLLFMLGLLTLLCSIYLYFAITLATDECSGRNGDEKALCLLKKVQKNRGGHGRARRLLSIQDSLRFNIEECSPDCSHYAPCQDERTASKPCRKRGEQPPCCRIAGPLVIIGASSGVQRTHQLGTMLEGNAILAWNVSKNGYTWRNLKSITSSQGLSSTGQIHRALVIGFREGMLVEKFLQQNGLTILVSGAAVYDCVAEMVLEREIPALQLMFVHEKLSLLAVPFDLLVYDACNMPRHENGARHFIQVPRLLRHQSYIFWSCQELGPISHRIKQLIRLMETNDWLLLNNFAAGLVNDHPPLIMKVFPLDNNTILVIRKGQVLPAFQQDWCDAFPSPPQTFDMVHASHVSEFEEERCNMLDILLEVDRLLRPGGIFIVRDVPHVTERVERLAGLLKWEKVAERREKSQIEMAITFLKCLSL